MDTIMRKRALTLLLALAVVCALALPAATLAPAGARAAGDVPVKDNLYISGSETTSDYQVVLNPPVTLTILSSTPLTLTGTATELCIRVANGVEANLTLEDVQITNTTFVAPIEVSNDGKLNLTIGGSGVSRLESAGEEPAIEVEPDAQLVIMGGGSGGSLEAISVGNGAGIGGVGGVGVSPGGDSGDITIGGDAVVVASSVGNGAGIGGGGSGSGGGSTNGGGGEITITGGAVVRASSGGSGAGIGGGGSIDGTSYDGGSGGTITIGDATVEASSHSGAGIGGGGEARTGGGGGTITIGGGARVTANGSIAAGGSAGIGGGSGGLGGRGGNITIGGDAVVTASGGGNGAGIGGGGGVDVSGGNGGIIMIQDDASVAANSGSHGAGIGGGGSGSGDGGNGGIIMIQDDATVVASSDGNGAGIGGGGVGDDSYGATVSGDVDSISITGSAVVRASSVGNGAGIGRGGVGMISNAAIAEGGIGIHPLGVLASSGSGPAISVEEHHNRHAQVIYHDIGDRQEVTLSYILSDSGNAITLPDAEWLRKFNGSFDGPDSILWLTTGTDAGPHGRQGASYSASNWNSADVTHLYASKAPADAPPQSGGDTDTVYDYLPDGGEQTHLNVNIPGEGGVSLDAVITGDKLTIIPDESQWRQLIEQAGDGDAIALSLGAFLGGHNADARASGGEGITQVGLLVPVEWFRALGMNLLLDAGDIGSLEISDTMLGIINDRYSGFIEFTVAQGSLAFDVRNNGSSIKWRNPDVPIRVGIPLETTAALPVVRVYDAESGADAVNVEYADGFAYGDVFATGRYAAEVVGEGYAPVGEGSGGAGTAFRVIASRLNVRSAPMIAQGNIIGQLSMNDVIVSSEVFEGWAKVTLSSGAVGYCSMRYLVPADGFAAGDLVTTTANLNLRTGPGTGNPVARVAAAGSLFELDGVTADGLWAWVEEVGRMLYMHTGYLR